jgi:hypothetical protein
MIYFPSPQNGQNDKDSPICRIHPPEMGRVESGNNAVQNKDGGAGKDVPEAFIFPQPEPDKISPAYLAKSSQYEQRNRPRYYNKRLLL